MRSLVEKIRSVEENSWDHEKMSLAEKIWHSFQRVEAGELKLAGVTVEDVQEILDLDRKKDKENDYNDYLSAHFNEDQKLRLLRLGIIKDVGGGQYIIAETS